MAAEKSNDRLFGRQRSVHEILGGGTAADVILWRRKNTTVGILVAVITAWTLFELSGYTLLSFVSSVLFLLVSILFVWAKTASILNRPHPPIPTLYFSEEFVNETAASLRCFMNEVLSGFNDIAFGKDSKLFLKVAVCLGLISFVGSLTDFVTLGYISFTLLLTLPVMYEKYEDRIDGNVLSAFTKTYEVYNKLNTQYICSLKQWRLEKIKID